MNFPKTTNETCPKSLLGLVKQVLKSWIVEIIKTFLPNTIKYGEKLCLTQCGDVFLT